MAASLSSSTRSEPREAGATAAASFNFTCLSFRIFGGAIRRTALAEKIGLRIALSEWLKSLQSLEQFGSDLVEIDFRIEIKDRLKVRRGQAQPGVLVQMSAQFGHTHGR